MSDYEVDSDKGKKAVRVFVARFFRPCAKVEYVPELIKEKYDVKVNGVSYEIKFSYKDDGKIIIEEWYDIDKKIKGWLYTSECDHLVYLSTKTILIYPFPAIKKFYLANKERYPEIRNKNQTVGLYGQTWWSSFRKIPMSDIPIQPIIW